MRKMRKKYLALYLVAIFSGTVIGADVILNEYNAVGSTNFLNGGNASADADNGRASDSYLGRVMGNGGDWFELVVITDHLDMRNWMLEIYEDEILDETLDLTNHSIWSDLRSGTIITVSEDVESDISYNPATGDWWINVQANDNANGVYIENSNFPVSNNNWQLRIKNAGGTIIFGPAGEGISPASGISDTEIFRLEDDPSTLITPSSTSYDDGKDFSTFGAPNRWGEQDFNELRTVSADPASITLLDPDGAEVIKTGIIYTITWQNQGTIDQILIEFSIDNGKTWSEVYPPNVGNSGQYDWFVPMVDAQQCLVRISSAFNPSVYDVSNGTFSIYQCGLPGDVNGDCIVNFYDFAVMALDWLSCANPYDPFCE